MDVRNKVDVKIGGKEYTLVGVESEEYIQKVSLYIDKKMNEIIRRNSSLSTAMAAVLTSINVADDYFKSVEKEKKLSEEFLESQSLIESLKEENKRLSDENDFIVNKNTNLQLELAKREAELNEVRNNLEKATTKPFNKPRLHVK